MPWVYWSRWNLMTRADHKRIYITKLRSNLKEIRCTLLSQLSLGIFHELLIKWVFFSNVQVQTSRVFLSFFYIYFFQQSQACAGSIPESQLKIKISHSLIHIGFIGLVTWSWVRGLRKKGLERLKECLRVILSKNFDSLACTFWTRLYSFCLIH